MRSWLRSPWFAIAVAVVGGIALGYGVGGLLARFDLLSLAWTVLGVILLWWAISDSRKARRGTPESEADGSHTIE